MSTTILTCLINQVPTQVTKTDNEFTIKTDTHTFTFYHEQDCCEDVYIDDICGDINDLIGLPLLEAEEVTSEQTASELPKQEQVKMQLQDKFPRIHRTYEDDSYTWTFYKFRNAKTSITIRWFGESNGYYSESVHLKIEQNS